MSSQLDEMFQNALAVMKNAYVPNSKFAVGACIRTPEGKLFSGCNFENASWSLSICAETSAIAMMISFGYSEIAEIAIVCSKKNICPPCGACRQRLYEFAMPGMKMHYFDQSGNLIRSVTIESLLPDAFEFCLE